MLKYCDVYGDLILDSKMQLNADISKRMWEKGSED